MAQSRGDAPPDYNQATGGSSHPGNNHLKASIPTPHRRSMEDETRPLPAGWVRTYDPATSHQFFVNTTVDPPRSIWVHPYDDEQYLSTLPSAERERIESLHSKPTKADIIAADSDDDDLASPSTQPSTFAELPPRPNDKGKGKAKQSFSQKLKDKLTGTTHEERVLERNRRAQAEDEAYRQHMHLRQAMSAAEQTGQPQWVGKDKSGHDVFLEPSYGVQPYPGPGGQYINPYSQGIYTNPNNRFIRPQNSYGRGYGYGYGGGMGLPIAGGLLGGMMLGGLLF